MKNYSCFLCTGLCPCRMHSSLLSPLSSPSLLPDDSASDRSLHSDYSGKNACVMCHIPGEPGMKVAKGLPHRCLPAM